MPKKIKILEATERLLAKHGFEHLSIQLVAAEAQVATGTIYRYFTDKNDLLQQLRLHVMTHCAERLLTHVDLTQINKTQFTQLWQNAWSFTLNRDDKAINREQFDSLPYPNSEEQKQRECHIFAPIHTFFSQGVHQGIFKPLLSDVLFSMSLEPAVHLAKKQAKELIALNDNEINQVIDACWDAIRIKETKPEHMQ